MCCAECGLGLYRHRQSECERCVAELPCPVRKMAPYWLNGKWRCWWCVAAPAREHPSGYARDPVFMGGRLAGLRRRPRHKSITEEKADSGGWDDIIRAMEDCP